MSVDIRIKTSALKVSAKLKKKKARINPQLLIGMRLALLKLRGQQVKDLTSKRFGLGRGRGRLANSLATVVRKSGDTVIGLMGTGLPYALAHEFGATITPKKSQYLTIPAKGIKGRAREYMNTFFYRKGGRLLLLQKTGKESIRLLFTLVKSVKLRKKKWMSKSYKGTKKDILAIMRRNLREAIAV